MIPHASAKHGFVVSLAAVMAALFVFAPFGVATSPVDAGASVATCAPHGIDTAACWICDPELREEGRLWCSEHERYEDRCWLCHPDLRDADRLYCEEHGLYEDECLVCRPEASGARGDLESGSELYCREHDLAEAECGICHPELADGLIPGGSLKIRLPSPESARLAGVESDRPGVADATPTVEAIGEVGYDRNRLARVTPLVDGVVREVHVDLGDRVAAGERLVTLASPRVAQVRADLQVAVAEEDAARRSLDREQELFDRGVSAERDLIDARSTFTAATARRAAVEQNLSDLGVTAGELEAMARGERAGSTFELRAPFDGTIVERSVVVGDVVSPGHELLRLADIRRMWVSVSVPEHELVHVDAGQRLRIQSGTTGITTEGIVTWVSSHLDTATRMGRVRAAIPNLEGRWKAGMFVDARVETAAAGRAHTVPVGAVHRFGGHPFVFVDRGEGLYEVRRVELFSRDGSGTRGEHTDHALVLSGLTGDERIVTARSFLVKSEFQKSRLGAGCVD